MLVKRHGCPFLVLARFPAASPSRPSERTRDKLRRRKHGTTGRLALPHQKRLKGVIAETVRSAPGRDPRMARFIRIFGALARLLAGLARVLGLTTGGPRAADGPIDMFVCISYK
jgi:hypothetical protein